MIMSATENNAVPSNEPKHTQWGRVVTLLLYSTASVIHLVPLPNRIPQCVGEALFRHSPLCQCLHQSQPNKHACIRLIYYSHTSYPAYLLQSNGGHRMPVVPGWDNSPVQIGPEPASSHTSQHEDDHHQQQLRWHHRCLHLANIRICLIHRIIIEHQTRQIVYFTSWIFD